MSRRVIGTMTKEKISPITGVTTERVSFGKSEMARAALIEDVTGQSMAVDDSVLPKELRIDIQRSDDFNNKRRKLRESFPESDLFEVTLPFPLQGERTLVYRSKPNEPLREVFPGGHASFTTAVLAEPEKVLLPIAGQAALGIPGMIAGSIASPFVEKGIEKLRGFDEGAGGELAIEGGLDAAINLTADIATRGFTRLLRGGISKGAGGRFREGLTELLPDSERVVIAQSAEGLAPLATGQLARSPITQTIFQQVSTITKRGTEFLNKQKRALFNNIEKKAQQSGTKGLSDEELGFLVKSRAADIDEGIAKLPQGTNTEGGHALAAGGQIFKDRTSSLGGRLYDKAFKISEAENVSFDISETVASARKMREGIKAQGKEVTEEVDTGVLDASGRPITRTETTSELINVREKLSADINSVITDLEKLDPILRTLDTPDGKSLAAKQIQALRSRLFDIRQRAEGEVMGKLANDLWGDFTTAMANPVGGSTRFAAAWKRANTFWRFREVELDKGTIAELIKSLKPEPLFNAFGRGGNFQALSRAKELIPAEQFNKFRESFVAELARDTDNITSRIAKLNLDKRSKSILLKPDEEKAILKFADQTKKLKESAINKLSTEERANIDRAFEITKDTTKESMEDLISRSGGDKSMFALSLRAGLYKHILNLSEDIDKVGNKILDPKKFEDAVKKVLSLESAETVLGKEGIISFNNLELYSNVIRQSSDVGSVLIRANIASGLSTPTKPTVVIKAARKILDKDIFSMLLAQPISRKGVLAASKLPTGSGRMRALGIAVASATNAYLGISKGNIERAKRTGRMTKDFIIPDFMKAAP